MPMSPVRVRAISLLVVVVLAASLGGCGTVTNAGPSGIADPSGEARDRGLEAAAAELDRALAMLERIHPEPFHAVERATFVAELEALKSRLPELPAEEAATELMRIWALLSTERDGHQFALPLHVEAEPVLPIRVYEFAEGVFVTDAMPPYEDLVGARLSAVGGMPIDEVLARLEPLVPRDGPATVASFRPMYLLRPIVLRGLGLAGPGPIALRIADDSGERTVELEPVPSERFRDWAGWMPFHGLAPREGLRHTQHHDDHFRLELLADDRVLYVRYAQVQPVPAGDLAELSRMAALPPVERVVLDLRQNTGGDNFTYPPLVAALSEAADRPERLVVLTDRVTFSAASNMATVLEQETSATFAGEPMGGGLNFWNDVTWVELPEFVLPMRVAVSTVYWQKATPDDPRLSIEPHIRRAVTAADYFAGRDRLLEELLAALDG